MLFHAYMFLPEPKLDEFSHMVGIVATAQCEVHMQLQKAAMIDTILHIRKLRFKELNNLPNRSQS